MPLLADTREEFRRTQIVEEAVRCFSRKGLERTSIADIIGEPDLSAGSIYAHYRNKADLVQTAARDALSRCCDTVGDYTTMGAPPDPDALLARLTAAIVPAKARVATQPLSEVITDPAIREIVADATDQMLAMLHDCVTTWLVKVEARGASPGPGARRSDHLPRSGALELLSE